MIGLVVTDGDAAVDGDVADDDGDVSKNNDDKISDRKSKLVMVEGAYGWRV